MLPTNIDELTTIVSRVFNIEDITRGDGKQGYLVRYRGRLVADDSAQAYDQLAEALRPRDITPLFRKEKHQQVVLLVQGVIRPEPSKAWVNLLLFALTMVSVFIAGTYYTLGSTYQGPPNPSLQALWPYVRSSVGGGLAFMVSLLAILVAHEFGHYLAGRYHRTHVTLPYFIPLPVGLGTMGAFIRLKEPPKNKRILLDIGIAGPLAGLVVAIPVLIIGLMLSEVSSIPAQLPPGTSLQIEGNSLLYLLAKYLVFGQLLPAPGSYGSLPAVQYWVMYFFTGHPLPLGGIDVMLSPVAWAAWAGLLVTALNLIPAGQLDGGHLIYVLLGKRANLLLPFILVTLVLLGFVWPGWWLWAFLIFILGRLHAEPLDQITTLNTGRRAVAWLGIIVFILVFTPVPLLAVGM
jgi:membrane-associated protease RseP (regulator of RpoE activity)